VSSGKTAAELAGAGVPVTTVEDVTGAPEMLGGRVKTLHPRIHGGLLADLGNDSHRADLEAQGIAPIELVVSNLYPFLDRPDIETIDIGGPAMVRAAAKNHAWVGVVTSPQQYGAVLEELRSRDATLSEETRRGLALEAFAHTAAYDAAIVRWLERDELLPRHLVLAPERTDDELRYGANPCGVAVAADTATAYQRALESDELSAFGGIVALNRPIDGATAERMVAGPQADVIVAPAYAPGTLDALVQKRKNTRLLEAPAP